jgi:hypothetical protein
VIANGYVAQQTDAYLALVQAERWNDPSRYSKAWLRSNLAVRSDRPTLQLHSIFKDGPWDLIPAGSGSGAFNDLTAYLSTFSRVT